MLAIEEHENESAESATESEKESKVALTQNVSRVKTLKIKGVKKSQPPATQNAVKSSRRGSAKNDMQIDSKQEVDGFKMPVIGQKRKK